MADKILKSITFPGLSDKYIIPETTVDATPTQGSTNAVQSGGVYSALSGLQAEIPIVDAIPTQSSNNAVSSGGVYEGITSTKQNINYISATVYSNNIEIDNGFSLFSGGININTGANVDTSPYNTTRCRSGYKVIDKARWELRNNQYEWMAYSYSSNAASAGVRLVSDWISGERDILVEKNFESELYIRFCFRKVDGSAFTTSGTDSDYDIIQNSVKKYIAAIEDINEVIDNEPNIFKLTNTLNRTVNGISLAVQSRDTLSFNGRATAKTRYYLLGGNGSSEINLPAGKYIFSRTLISGTASSNPFFAYTDSTHTEQSILLNIEKEFTEDATILLIVNNGYTFSDAIYTFEIREAGTTAIDNVSREYIDKHSKSIKILGIGNSYTRDSFRWLCKILLDAGYNAVVAHAYWGASTLAEQYASLDPDDANHSVFQIRKYDNAKNFSSLDNMPLETLLTDEKWDVVIFQQQSDEAGQYSSFVSSDFDINDFISYVKTAIGNDDLKIGIALTWSHAHGYTGEKFVQYYGGDPTVQYDAIKQTIPQVANHMSQCDFIVNVGDAVEYGRDNAYLSTLGTELLRTDKNHLYYGIPSYMAGMVYAMTICGINGTESTWYPTAEDEGVSGVVTSANYARIARQCAKKATMEVI